MLFCHLGQAKSLREISLGLGFVHGKIRHLGTKRAPNKSTLAHANLKRNPKVFEEVFYCLYESILSKTQHGLYKPKKKGRTFRFKNKLLSLDASIITLCTKTFDWAHYNRSKGGIKLHLILDHDGHLPRFATLTTANFADISAAKSMDFPSHCVLTFDRVSWDYKWMRALHDKKIFFVTRFRGWDQGYELVKSRIPLKSLRVKVRRNESEKTWQRGQGINLKIKNFAGPILCIN